MMLGVGAALTLATTGIDFATKVFRKTEPFPVWDVKWKQFRQAGWVAKTKMNVFDNQIPPKSRAWNGVHYDLYRANSITRSAIYIAR